MLRLGYPCVNIELRNKDIVTDRTIRLATASNFQLLTDVANSNLDALLKILEWNERHDMKFYRISSNLFPHITNPKLRKRLKLSMFKDKITNIGNFINKHKHRVTFHPNPFLSMGGDEDVMEELRFHTDLINMMNLDSNSVMIIHGGGVYKNKDKTIRKWVKKFNSLPLDIKSRIALENDEFSYSLDDVIYISNSVDSFKVDGKSVKIPIVLDFFHYKCYKEYQTPLDTIIEVVIKTWKHRRVKMHLSEQRLNSKLGAHSDYVKVIPSIVFRVGDLDLMIEAKQKEQSVLLLRKKYSH